MIELLTENRYINFEIIFCLNLVPKYVMIKATSKVRKRNIDIDKLVIPEAIVQTGNYVFLLISK